MNKFITVINFVIPVLLCLTLSSCMSGKLKKKSASSTSGSFKSRTAYKEWIQLRRASSELSLKEFYETTKALSKKYPEEDTFKIYEAALLGDYGQTLSAEKEKEYKLQATKMIEPFFKKKWTNKYTFDRLLTFNEYYYHSGNYLKQYFFGKEVLKTGGPGNFSIGVGGSMWAIEMANKGQCAEAKVFAAEAVQAFEVIKSEEELAHNPFYIGALALSDRCSEAQKIYDEDLSQSNRYEETTRWMGQFNPKSLSCCKKP